MPEYVYESEGTSPDLAFKVTLIPEYRADCLPHWHNSLEVIHILQGSLRVIVNDRRYTMHSGDVIVVNAGEVHSTYSAQPNAAALLQVPNEFLKMSIPDFDSVRFGFNTVAMKSGRKGAVRESLETLSRLYDAYRKQERGYSLKVTGLLFDFLHQLYCNFSLPREITPHKSDKYMERLKKVTEFIKKHYREPVTLQRMAAVVYLNPEYFNRFFKKYMGMTPMTYLNSVRVQNIGADLLATDINITDLAALHGCQDYTLFLRHFHSVFGCTPSQYRRRHADAGASA